MVMRAIALFHFGERIQDTSCYMTTIMIRVHRDGETKTQGTCQARPHHIGSWASSRTTTTSQRVNTFLFTISLMSRTMNHSLLLS